MMMAHVAWLPFPRANPPSAALVVQPGIIDHNKKLLEFSGWYPQRQGRCQNRSLHEEHMSVWKKLFETRRYQDHCTA